MICEICRLEATDISPINMVSIGFSRGRKSRSPEDARASNYIPLLLMADDAMRNIRLFQVRDLFLSQFNGQSAD